MTTSSIETDLEVEATAVRVTDSDLVVEFEDGRTLSVPLAWYPRLGHGTAKERNRFEVGHFGIHWPDLDEDISFRGLLLGRGSGESAGSLAFWLANRRQGRKVTLEDYSKYRRKSQGSTSKRRKAAR